MGHTFISYSRRDSVAVERLAERLAAAGAKGWLDREGIRGGAKWRASIVEAIRSADAVLLVLSANSVQSESVRKELDLADEFGKPIIPVELEPTIIPTNMSFQIAGLQKIRLFDDFERGMRQILDALDITLSSERAAPETVKPAPHGGVHTIPLRERTTPAATRAAARGEDDPAPDGKLHGKEPEENSVQDQIAWLEKLYTVTGTFWATWAIAAVVGMRTLKHINITIPIVGEVTFTEIVVYTLYVFTFSVPILLIIVLRHRTLQRQLFGTRLLPTPHFPSLTSSGMPPFFRTLAFLGLVGLPVVAQQNAYFRLYQDVCIAWKPRQWWRVEDYRAKDILCKDDLFNFPSKPERDRDYANWRFMRLDLPKWGVVDRKVRGPKPEDNDGRPDDAKLKEPVHLTAFPGIAPWAFRVSAHGSAVFAAWLLITRDGSLPRGVVAFARKLLLRVRSRANRRAAIGRVFRQARGWWIGGCVAVGFIGWAVVHFGRAPAPGHTDEPRPEASASPPTTDASASPPKTEASASPPTTDASASPPKTEASASSPGTEGSVSPSASDDLSIGPKLSDKRETVAPSTTELEALYDKAFRAFDANNYTQALKDLDAIDRRAPDIAESANLRGVIQMRQKDYRNAEKSLRKALAVDPKFWNARFNFAEIPFLQGKWPQARERYEELLKGNASELQGEARQLIEYKILLINLMEGKLNNVESILSKFRATPEQPALHFANAAIALKKRDDKAAKDALTTAQKKFSQQLNKLFSESLYALGLLERQ